MILVALVAGLLGPSFRVGEAVELEPAGQAPLSLTPGQELAEAPTNPDEAEVSGERVLVGDGAAEESELEAMEPAEGERRVTGRVVDELGRPVAGALVEVSRSGGLLLELEGLRGIGRARAEARTDGQGEFVLTSGLRGKHPVEVKASGFAPLRVDRDLAGGEVAPLEDLVLLRGVELRGFVVDAAGLGVAGVGIVPRTPQPSGFVVTLSGRVDDPDFTTEDDGSFHIDQLAAGPFELALQHPDHPTKTVTGTVERAGELVTNLRYTLEDGFPITGFVRGSSVSEGQALEVRARPLGQDLYHPETLQGERRTEVAADGSFRLRGLARGRYVLHLLEPAEGRMWSPASSAGVEAEAGDAGVELRYSAGHGVTFRVVDDLTGEPVEAFRVEYGSQFLRPVVDDDGRVRERYEGGRVELSDARVEEDTLVTGLRISSDRHERFDLEGVKLSADEVVDLGELRLKPVPELVVRVVEDGSGEPVEGARVVLREHRDLDGLDTFLRVGVADLDLEDGGVTGLPGISSQLRERKGATDGDGIVRLGSLPGRQVDVEVKARGLASGRLEGVVLPAADHELEVRLSQGGTARVTVLDPQDGPIARARVRTRPEGANHLGAGEARRTRESGVVTFSGLAPGRHRFWLVTERGQGTFLIPPSNAGSDEGVVVEVSEGGEVEVVLRAPARALVRGRVTENGQALPGARLSFSEKRSEEEGGALSGLSLFGGSVAATTDSRGEYEAEGLEAGPCTVRISHPERAMDATFELDIAPGESGEDFALTVAVLEGRIVDSEGRPAAGVEVRAERAGDDSREVAIVMMSVVSDSSGAVTLSSGPGQPRPVRTDEDGRYSLRGVEPHVPLVVQAVEGAYEAATSREVEVADGQVRADVDLVVHEGGSLLVSVVDSAGSPVDFCTVQLRWAGEAEGAPGDRNEFAGPGGAVLVEGLRPGSWEVTAREAGVMTTLDGQERPARSAPAQVRKVEPGEAGELTLVLEG